jgi:glucokinase-like ROK family protein
LTQAAIKQTHRSAILRLIKDEGTISRTEISQRLHLSRTTATVIANELLEEGIVMHARKGTSHGGRRPALLSFNADFGHILAVEIGANNMALAVTNLGAGIKARTELRVNQHTPEAVVSDIIANSKELLREAGLTPEMLLGVGVNVPGLVDSEGGIVEKAVNLGWESVPLRELLQPHFGVPVAVIDKGDGGALGEKLFGVGQGCSDFIFITIGTGIGAGVMYRDVLFTGARNAAGEFGHISVDPSGRRCLCGNVGCLEHYCSAQAIVRMVQENCPPGSILAGREDLTAYDVYLAALENDAFAAQVFDQVGTVLGKACVTLIHLFNPRKLVFGGGVSQAGDLLLAPIRKAVKEFAMASSRYDVEVVQAGLGPDSGLVGAAALVIDDFLSTF